MDGDKIDALKSLHLLVYCACYVSVRTVSRVIINRTYDYGDKMTIL